MDQTSTYSPLVMQETSDGLRLYDIRDEMLASREIEITGAIDAGSVSTAIRCLLHLQKEDQQLPISPSTSTAPAEKFNPALRCMT